jgi:DNA-binding transcriptional MerR regulator
MNGLYRVREFAKLTGVTVKALHHYDRLGLLEPRRSRAGYRLYSAADRNRLEQIAALKFVGLPLRQIRSLLNRRSPSLNDVLTRQRRALEEQRTRLDRAVAAIDWELREAELAARSTGVRRAPDRFNDARVSLYHDIAAAIDAGAADDLDGACAQELIARWRAIVDDEMSNADEAMKAKIREMWAHRKTWPASLKRYVASLYRLEPAVWDRVADFIDRGSQSPVTSQAD